MTALAGSVLIAIPKSTIPSDGNANDVRPIAMGEVYRKLAASLIIHKYQSQIDSIMGNIQLGVGNKCGTEKIIHSSSIWFADGSGDIVLIDFKNAFNTVSRDMALQNFQTYLPDLYPFVKAIYGAESQLWLSITDSYTSIVSSEGAQQGDPLGPLFFAIATIPLLNQLRLTLDQGSVNAYLDDITQLAGFDSQCRAISLLKSLAPRYGLSINFKKFKILMARCGNKTEADRRRCTYTTLCQGISQSNILSHPLDDPSSSDETYGLEILGTPVGSQAFVTKYLDRFINISLAKELARLDQVTHLQSLWCFVHYVVNSKITHLLRTVAPTLTQLLISGFTSLQMKLTQRVFNIQPLSGVSNITTTNLRSAHDPVYDTFSGRICQEQMRLPISAGGMGLRHFEDVAQVAYLASVVTCRHHLASLNNNIPLKWTGSSVYDAAKSGYTYWSELGLFSREDILRPSNSFDEWLYVDVNLNLFKAPHLQKKLTGALTNSRISTFQRLVSSSIHDKVRIGSLANSMAGNFLAAWPRSDWRLSNEEFLTILRLRHGLPVIPSHPILQCRCYRHSLVDYLGDHLLCCICGPQIIHRHNQLVYAFRTIGRDSGIRSSSNFAYIHTPNSANSKHQVDFIFFQPNLSSDDLGRDYLFDVSVVHPTAPSYLDSNKVTATSSLSHFSQKKIEKHRSNAESLGKKFVPLVFYSLGTINDDAQKLIHTLSERHSERIGCHFSVSFYQLSTTINITLLRGTANVIIDRFRSLVSDSSSSHQLDSTSQSPDDFDSESNIPNSNSDFNLSLSQSLVDNIFDVLPNLSSSR